MLDGFTGGFRGIVPQEHEKILYPKFAKTYISGSSEQSDFS